MAKPKGSRGPSDNPGREVYGRTGQGTPRTGRGSTTSRKTNKLLQGLDISQKYGTKKNVNSPKDAVKAIKEIKTRVAGKMDRKYKIVSNPKYAGGYGPERVKSRTSSYTGNTAPVKPSSRKLNAKRGK